MRRSKHGTLATRNSARAAKVRAAGNSCVEALEARRLLSSAVFGAYQGIGTLPAGLSGFHVATGDFTNNGKTDIVVSTTTGSPYSTTLEVYFPTGNGTFQSTALTTSVYPGAIAVGDFNGDGNQDIAVTGLSANVVSFFYGTGNGTFGPRVDVSVDPGSTAFQDEPGALTTGDFNGDGKLDLAVANGRSDSVAILMNTGNAPDGTATFALSSFATGPTPAGIVSGDFNKDGKTDLAVSEFGDDDVHVFIGNGNGTFTDNGTYATAPQPYELAAGDLNGDGRTDLVIPCRNAGGQSYVSVLLANPDGSFSPAPSGRDYPVSALTSDVTLADFNGNGIADFAASAATGNAITVYQGHGDGTFSNPQTLSLPAGVNPDIAAGDFFGNGKPDLALAGGPTVGVIPNNTPVNPTVTWNAPADIPFGTPLTSAQLDASASVQGSFVYTPAAGTVLPAGQNQTLSVLFTPFDTADYNAVTATTSINVAVNHTLTVTNTADSGTGSLRQAIINANNNPGADTIVFAIPGSGVHTISPSTPLPQITDSTVINGESQSGYAGVPLIEINGTAPLAGGVGLDVTSSSNTIEGLTIDGFSTAQISIEAASSGNVIAGNYIGTDTTGTIAQSSSAVGILVAGSNNTIGGFSAAARNIISGNSIGVELASGSKNLIEANYIGTDVTGTLSVGNALAGIQILDPASNNTIGNGTAATSNIIAFNGNGSAGSGGVIIGDAGNITIPVGNALLDNSIFSNNGLGISLGSGGANNAVAPPAISGVTNTAFSSAITFDVYAAVGSKVHIELYSNPNAASGPGKNLLIAAGGITVPARSPGQLYSVITATIPVLKVTQDLGATLTDSVNDTSAFSQFAFQPPTTTTVGNAAAVYGQSAAIALSANVASYTPVNEGTVTFNVLQGATTVTTLTSGTVANGIATASLSAGGLTAGNYTISATYNPASSNPNFAASTSATPGTLIVSKANPVITWSAPAGISFGTPLTSTQLDASASVAGTTFAYTPAAGTVLPAGQNQTLSVLFTPADTTDYNSVTQTTSINVAVNHTLTVANTADSGTGSLRQAIINANNNPGADTIVFAIPGSGVHTISPSTPLPQITDSTIINGESQSGYAGVPLIEINGTAPLAGGVGLDVTSSSNTIEGLTIDGFSTAQISIEAASSGNVIAGNYIGTDTTGTIAQSSSAVGILVAGSNNTIGGFSAAARNIISGNSIGVELASGSKNLIEANYIGTDVTGTLSVGNTLAGIQILDPASNNTIGNGTAGTSNIIAFNGNGSAGSGGVIIGDAGNITIPVGNALLDNSIFSNNGLGISLGSGGANNAVAPPTISNITTASSSTITLHVYAAVGSKVHIELYSSPTAAAGQGKTLLIAGSGIVVPARSPGQLYSVITVSVSALRTTAYISGTLTDAANDTSGFSSPFRVN